jgi:DNA-directed RNA polymerase specialized sigma24 family protein
MSPHEHFDSLADDDLLRNIVQGCTDCFALLFHRYCRQVFSVSFRIIRDKPETEDILQEVFLSIFLQQERYDPARGSIRTWILQFAYFKSLLRRRYLRIRHFYDLTGLFCTSRREREFKRRTAGYAKQEVQSGTDRDVAAPD